MKRVKSATKVAMNIKMMTQGVEGTKKAETEDVAEGLGGRRGVAFLKALRGHTWARGDKSAHWRSQGHGWQGTCLSSCMQDRSDSIRGRLGHLNIPRTVTMNKLPSLEKSKR